MACRTFALVVIVCLLLFSPSLVDAQSTAATITGFVTDPSKNAIAEAKINVTNLDTNLRYTVTTDLEGRYTVPALPPGNYKIEVEKLGFKGIVKPDVVLHVQDAFAINFQMALGSVSESVTVEAGTPLLESQTSSTGSIVTPQNIEEMPINGRNFLDLMQLVPGVTVNRQADQGSDSATPVLGERAGNTVFMIDGLPNANEFGGGASAQFNQDTILEFQVITTGYKAEFGHGSGGIVNVITKSGTNDWHGEASLYHRNSALDRNDSLDPTLTSPPLVLRWDYGITGGGPIIKDKFFVFGSAERIQERRQLNFAFAPGTPQVVIDSEDKFNLPNRTFDTRIFGKLDQQLGKHHISEEINQTNAHVTDFLPLSQATSLPSTRRNNDGRTTSLGFRDMVLLGTENPYVLSVYFQYRDIPFVDRPAHPDAGPETDFSVFSATDTGLDVGDITDTTFGSGLTTANIHQKYLAFGGTVERVLGRHGFKFGADFLRTKVDGIEQDQVSNQIFCTAANYVQFGPLNCGFFTLSTTGGVPPNGDVIRMRNNYVGPFVQDDWKIRPNLTLNLGVRWDFDSQFNSKNNFSPRVGFAWSVTPKTVIRGSFGTFYDHFRLGLARDIPGFGGANLTNVQPFSYPQLFYNLTSDFPSLFGVCVNPTLTEAQVQGQGLTCSGSTQPQYGFDFLNNIVAAGHSPIPAATPVNLGNVQSLSGLTSDQYLAAVNSSVALPPGFQWFWGPFGTLSHTASPASGVPFTVAPGFTTPRTYSTSIGVQQQISTNSVIGVEYINKQMDDLLGIRETNLDFISRIPGNALTFDSPNTVMAINNYGPWFSGHYHGLVVTFREQFRNRFSVQASYTFTRAFDNLFRTELGGGGLGLQGIPSDNFVGIPPVVTDPATGQTNANGPFVASNGNPVPQAGKFYNGANVDYGRSPLALQHVFVTSGTLELPKRFRVSGIFTAQSGFPFSRLSANSIDYDGNFNFSGQDFNFQRNSFTAPPFVDLDLRVSKEFRVKERLKIVTLIEFFNVLNRQNPAAVQGFPDQTTPFGRPLQVLPGMESQVGVKFEY